MNITLFVKLSFLVNSFKLSISGPPPTSISFMFLFSLTSVVIVLINLSKLFSGAILPTEPIRKSSSER